MNSLKETAQSQWVCCNGSHEFCWACDVDEHFFGDWKPQKLFAFEERVCTCCEHAESRALPEGEEEI